MVILEAEPTGWVSRNARIRLNDTDLTELTISPWKSRGSFSLNGEDYAIEPQEFWLINAVLKKGSTIIARAQKPSLMRRSFVITSAGHRMTLESRSWSGREYALLIGTQEVGRVTRKGMTGRRVRLEFPDEVPVVLQLFLTYLVLCQAKRESDAVAAGS